MPWVTIIIPVYNTEKYLKKCLDSVVNQTYKNIEIIIINDASTDCSFSILREYEKNYKNIRLIHTIKNEGLSEARNRGLEQAQGEYIYFLDSDDWIRKDTIEKLVNLATIYDVPLVEARFASVFSNREPKQTTKIQNKYENLEKEKELIQNRDGMACNKLYTHDLIGNSRFPKNLNYEDNAFVYPILTIAKKALITNEVFYFYRRHLNSFIIRSSFFPNDSIFDLYEISKIIKNKCIELGTYDKYKESIDAIILEKVFDSIRKCSTWISIKEEDKRQVLNNLYQYNRKQFQIPCLKEMCNSSLREKLLLYYINENAHDTTYETSLEPAKRILSQYKR